MPAKHPANAQKKTEKLVFWQEKAAHYQAANCDLQSNGAYNLHQRMRGKKA